MLSKSEKDKSRAELLKRMSLEERYHYEFWKKLLGEDCSREVSISGINKFKIMRKVLGLTFTLKYLERHENNVVEEYEKFKSNITDDRDKVAFEKIIEDEINHEKIELENIDERIVKYMSFIILGLADAIVEITGVHAGFLGVTESTIVTGIAGLVVGLSAAISMASAAYLQAKHDLGRSPKTSALMTGISYILAVVLLAAPYFILRHMLTAFIISVSLAVAMIAGFTYYGAILLDKKFFKEFTESTLLMLGTALASYLFGDLLGTFFGIRGIFG